MKKLTLLLLIFFSFMNGLLLGNGVAIKNAENSEYFKLLEADVDVTVYDQIAIVVATQKFINNTGGKTNIKYAFPLAEDASGIGLRWNLGNTWYSAVISPSPQDTTLPGGGGDNTQLQEFLGETPLFFDLEDSIPNDSILIVELTYVQLLPYKFYTVYFDYPNDYSLIQSEIINYQHIRFNLESQRKITGIAMLSHQPDSLSWTDSTAMFEYTKYEGIADKDYAALYNLSGEDLGLFSYSTFITDTAFDCDNYGNGFFTFMVEPDPQSEVIQKVFTLIIDRSGSMSGNKIIQARDAASYITEHLNEGDYFNIVDFSTDATKLFEDHQPYNATTESDALTYISSIYADGGTNIGDAFSNAIPDFASNDTTLANIIVFFTDGEATAGLIDTQQILDHIQNLITVNEVTNLQIHTFGIGDYTVEALLSQIASQNDGISEFLGNEELEEVITEFYLTIRNPVLINTEMTVDPPILTEIYPDPLDNLYLGQQLVAVGRYDTAQPIDVTLTGEAFGQPQSYQYSVELADTTIPTYQFLTKLWAKEKMDKLMEIYYTFDEGSPGAEEIRNEIIAISTCYNVISPFTSYTGGGTTFIEYDGYLAQGSTAGSLCRSFPNPFVSEVTIEFVVHEEVFSEASIRIFDAFGRLIDVSPVRLNGKGTYRLMWNGKDAEGNPVPPGYYFYTIHYDRRVLTGKMVKL
ncbi:MAG: VWA domain-containing protein [bacterium]